MHFKLIVLISVTLTLVQLSHTFRVPGAQNGPEQQQHFRLSDNNYNVVDDDDYLVPANNNRMKSSRYNSLSDILNNDEDEEEEEEEQEPSSAEYEADFNKELEKIISQQDQHKAAASSRASKGSRLAADFEEYLKSAPSSSAPAAAAAATASKPASQSAADPVVVVEDEEELESHSSLVGGQGHQYVSGGAGEGKQHLQPDGAIDNKEEVKSDEDLPAYCDPPNPCPLGVVADDCDPRPFDMFSAQFSKEYQEQQNCMCDDDHNECHKRSKNSGGSGAPSERVSDLINNLNNKLTVVAKKSPRVRREVKSDQNATKRRLRNPYLRGEAINIHVAKKSTHF